MNKKLTIIVAAIFSLAIVFSGCEDRSDLTAPGAPNTGDADFTSFVAIGNSLTAGLQNGALYSEAQENSFPKMIADRVETKFVQPLMGGDGTGTKIEITALDTFATTQKDPHQQEPVNMITYEQPYNNLGIPSSVLVQMLDTSNFASRDNGFFQLILRNEAFGKSVVEQASSLNPTFVTLWIGNNDVLGYATSGGTEGTDMATGTLPTSKQTFQQYFEMVGGALVQTGAKVAIANIPKVTSIPYFTTVGPGVGLKLQALQQQGQQIPGLFYQKKGDAAVPQTQFASPDDLIDLNNVLLTLPGSAYTPLIGDTTGAFYGGQAPQGIDITEPFGLHPANPWPHSLTLDEDEISTTNIAISDFNGIISEFANSRANFVLVDINSFFNDKATNGYQVDGLQLSTQFVQGGIFSLDGVHPTSRGYAIVANQFIQAINEGFNANIPRINVATVSEELPLAKGSILNKYGIPKAAPGTFEDVIF